MTKSAISKINTIVMVAQFAATSREQRETVRYIIDFAKKVIADLEAGTTTFIDAHGKGKTTSVAEDMIIEAATN